MPSRFKSFSLAKVGPNPEYIPQLLNFFPSISDGRGFKTGSSFLQSDAYGVQPFGDIRQFSRLKQIRLSLRSGG